MSEAAIRRDIELDTAWIEGYHQAIADGVEADKKVKIENRQLKLSVSALTSYLDQLEATGLIDQLEEQRWKQVGMPTYVAHLERVVDAAERALVDRKNKIFETRLASALDAFYQIKYPSGLKRDEEKSN